MKNTIEEQEELAKDMAKGDKNKSTESAKVDKEVKRSLNSRIIEANCRKSTVAKASSKVEETHVQKSRMRQQSKKPTEAKSNSHKRVHSPCIHNDTSVVDKKRARIDPCIDRSKIVKSSGTKEKEKSKSKQKVPSWNFKEIRTNIYSDSVKPIQSPDSPHCSCKPEYECGKNCFNRLVYTECNPETCPCGDKCQNTKIQNQIVIPVERFITQNKGWGVRTNQLIMKGNFVLEYIGEVITLREFKERMGTMYKNDVDHYCLHLQGNHVIDASRMGNDSRCVNHSCDPNCHIEKWIVNGMIRMALFSIRDIHPGEELSFDYNFSSFNPREGQVCRCESKNCRGIIGRKSYVQCIKDTVRI